MIAVVASYVIVKLFIQPVSTLNQYVFMTYFQDTSSLAMASLTTMGPMLLGMVFLKPLVKRFGKKALVTWPLLGSALMHGANMLLPLGPKEWIFCQLMASACITCLNLLLWSLIADAVDYQAYLTGQRNDGTVYATITFIVFLLQVPAHRSLPFFWRRLDMIRLWVPWDSWQAYQKKSKCWEAHGR